jgi:hypothetical protein
MAAIKKENVKISKGILDNVSGTIGAINITKNGVVRIKKNPFNKNKRKKS